MEEKKYIELNTFLKIKGIAQSGGSAKHIIKEGNILVNNELETRNKRKLFGGEVISYQNKQHIVNKDEIL